SDAPDPERDRESTRAAQAVCREVLVVRHPIAASRFSRLAYRAWGRMAGFRLGDWLHCPPRFTAELRRRFARRPYRAVIVSGAHLARGASPFRPPVLRILEAQDVWYDRSLSYAALGRGAELQNFADPRREAALARRFDAVLALSARDRALLQEIGVTGRIEVV